jgi:hypothetical protein
MTTVDFSWKLRAQKAETKIKKLQAAIRQLIRIDRIASGELEGTVTTREGQLATANAEKLLGD